MTVTLTNEHLYLGIIIVLMVIQVYQQRHISKLERECSDIWNQIAILVTSISTEMTGLQKSLNSKKDKE